MFGLLFGVFMLSEGLWDKCFEEFVRSVGSVFFCGWNSDVILVCLVASALWLLGVTGAVSCLLLLLGSCTSVMFVPSSYPCSFRCFCSPSCFVPCCWVVDVVLPPRWYSSSSSFCTRSKASWCSMRSSHIPVFFRKSGLSAMCVRMESI